MSGTASNFVTFVDNIIPTISGLPSTATFTEDTKDEIDLSSVLFADADGDDLTVTLTASAGVFDTPADGAAGGVTETLVSSTVVTLAGSPAAINSYLDTAANLQYTPAADVSGTAAATLNLQANDGTSTAALGTVNINITAVDDPVTLSGVPTSQTFTEDTIESIALSAITAGDVDGDTLTMLLTLSAGEFDTPADGAGVSVTETRVSSSQVRLVGSAGAINSYLDITDAIDYVPVADAFGTAAATLSLSLTDSVASTVTGSITFDITGTNEAPVLRTGDVRDDRFVTAGDDDGDGSDGDDDATDNANNQGLTVAELLTLLDYSDADGAADAKGIAIYRVRNPSSPYLGTIEYSTDNGGSWTEVTATRGIVYLNTNALLLDGGSTGASTHRVRFNAKGRGLTGILLAYAWDKTQGTAGETADASIVGGATAFSSGWMSVTFSARATTAPVISNLNRDFANYAIGAGPVAFDVGADAAVSHSGGGTFTSGTLDFSFGGFSGQDSIRFATSLGVAVTSESSGGIVSVGGVDVGTFAGISDFVTRVRVTLNSDATLSRINTLIRSLVYDNSSSTPATHVRELLTALTFDSALWTTESYVRLVSIDLDATLTAATGVTEPVALPTTADTVGEALDLLDFTLTDGGTADALALGVSQVVLNVSGTATDAQRGQITWRLNGPDASDVSGTYSGGADTITFSGLSISVADGASEIYTVNAYFNDTANMTDNATIILSVDGDTDLTTSGTGMGTTTAVTNGSGTLTTVAATKLAYATEPAGSASGVAFTTQPVVHALDAANNLDLDFTETITLSTSGGGSLSGDVDIAATAGVATFAGVAYAASADKESFTVSADDEATGGDLAAITSSSLSSEVTATRLVFQVQPTPRSAFSGDTVTFAPALTVAAVDSAGVVDSDYTTSVSVSETGGAGSVVFAFAGDTDADEATVTMNAVAGLASFSGLTSRYAAATGSDETYTLAANSSSFAQVLSLALSSSPFPPPPDPTIRGKVDRTGTTSTDPEVGEEGELTGGKVCGDAKSEGKITDVTLCGGATITGGEVGGDISGDPDDPATLSGVTVLPGSRLSNVNVEADVILLKGVIIGDNVGFASFLNMPSGVALTNTLEFIPVPGREGQTALDLRGEAIAGAATEPRTSYLELVAEVPEFDEPGAAIRQQPQGEIEMEFPDSESRMVPIRVAKTDTPTADETGFRYDEDGNLSIRLPSSLEVIMYPMFTDDDALLAAIEKEDSAYGLKYGVDSYFEITKDTETGLAATLPRYVGRPGLSAVKLAAGTERELGFFTYSSPFLANVNAVSLITRSEDGTLMEQEMVPTPRDWLQFKARVGQEKRSSRVSINPRGLITVREAGGKEFHALADYEVTPNAAFAKEGRPIVFINVGDLNGDGEPDYHSYYANGDRQTIYVLPAP
jgi:hypothetical protein